MSLLTIEGVSKEYRSRGKQVVALEGIDLNIAEGEFVTIVGPSGCGKSTLLNLIVGLMRSSTGQINFNGARIDGICTKIGYVTQKDNLLPWRTLMRKRRNRTGTVNDSRSGPASRPRGRLWFGRGLSPSRRLR